MNIHRTLQQIKLKTARTAKVTAMAASLYLLYGSAAISHNLHYWLTGVMADEWKYTGFGNLMSSCVHCNVSRLILQMSSKIFLPP